jgi:hypothetical protein
MAMATDGTEITTMGMEMDGVVAQQETEKLRMSRTITADQLALELEILQLTIAGYFKKTWLNRLQKRHARLSL